MAANIEAIFISFGWSEFSKRQDPISFNKMTDLVVLFLDKLLGQILDTRLDVGVPPTFIADTLHLLKLFHYKYKLFTVKEMEKILEWQSTLRVRHPGLNSSCPRCIFLLQLE